MGQWVVSVPGLEPLHLTVTLASRARWSRGYLTLRPERRQGAGSTAGRRQARKKSISGLRDVPCPAAAHATWTGTPGRGERVPAVSRSTHLPGIRAGPRSRGAAGSGVHLPAVRGPARGDPAGRSAGRRTWVCTGQAAQARAEQVDDVLGAGVAERPGSEQVA
jgi:hypothetical protein